MMLAVAGQEPGERHGERQVVVRHLFGEGLLGALGAGQVEGERQDLRRRQAEAERGRERRRAEARATKLRRRARSQSPQSAANSPPIAARLGMAG